MPEEIPLYYRPSSFYFRQALREAATIDEAVAVGMRMALELEQLKEFCRENGLIPPRRYVLDTEAEEKQLRLL